jgi:hypothetical protein
MRAARLVISIFLGGGSFALADNLNLAAANATTSAPARPADRFLSTGERTQVRGCSTLCVQGLASGYMFTMGRTRRYTCQQWSPKKEVCVNLEPLTSSFLLLQTVMTSSSCPTTACSHRVHFKHGEYHEACTLLTKAVGVELEQLIRR